MTSRPKAKHLQPIGGHSQGVVIPKWMLTELDIDRETPLYVTRRGDDIMITVDSRARQIGRAVAIAMADHAHSLELLD